MDWSENPDKCDENDDTKQQTICLRMLWVDGHEPSACMEGEGMNSWMDDDCCAPKGMGSCMEGFTYFEGEQGCHWGAPDEDIYNTYCSQICEGKSLFGCGLPIVNRLFGFNKGDQRVNPEYHVFMEAFWKKYGAEMAGTDAATTAV